MLSKWRRPVTEPHLPQRTYRPHQWVDEAGTDTGAHVPDGQDEAARCSFLVRHVGQRQVGLGHADGQRAEALRATTGGVPVWASAHVRERKEVAYRPLLISPADCSTQSCPWLRQTARYQRRRTLAGQSFGFSLRWATGESETGWKQVILVWTQNVKCVSLRQTSSLQKHLMSVKMLLPC